MTHRKWVDGYPKDHSEVDCKHKTCNRCALISTILDFIPLQKKESIVRGLSEQGCQVKKPYICKRTNISSECLLAFTVIFPINFARWKISFDTNLSCI